MVRRSSAARAGLAAQEIATYADTAPRSLRADKNCFRQAGCPGAEVLIRTRLPSEQGRREEQVELRCPVSSNHCMQPTRAPALRDDESI